MVNFTGISDKSFIGKLLRLPLSLIPSGTKLPILQGKLRGKRWIVGSGTHGCWLGSYEIKKRRLIEQVVTEGSVMYDIGANAGFFTLLASVLVGPKGRVIAFEPLPRNLGFLKENLGLNRMTNVTVIEAAVSDHGGVASFAGGASDALGHLALNGEFQVTTVSLDDLVERREIPTPDDIKMDVEGAEMLVLAGAKSILLNVHPALFIDTHGRDVHRQALDFLESLGYQFQFIDGKDREESGEVFAWFEK